MSWDADLSCDACHHTIGSWNYTYNTSPMIYDALERCGIAIEERTWGDHLDGLTGPQGAEFLGTILGQLRADPQRYLAMNPPNGWGDYDGLVKVLDEMHRAVPEAKTTWWMS